MLIAALLELKSRLMLPGEELEELDELAPAEAAEELLERMLAVRPLPRRGRVAARARHEAEQAVLYRSAPLPAALRRAPPRAPCRPTTRRCSARRSAGCCARRRRSTCATWRCRASRWPSASRSCAACCAARRRSPSTRRSRDADRMTVAVTVFALLELYKRGEAGVGAGRAVRADHGAGAGAARGDGRAERSGGMSLARDLEALLFLAPDPVPVDELADALRVEEDEVAAGLRRAGAPRWTAAASCCASSRAAGRSPRTRRRGGRPAPARPPAHAGAHARPGRDAGDRRLPAAGLAPRGRAHPRRRARSRRPPRWPSAA